MSKKPKGTWTYDQQCASELLRILGPKHYVTIKVREAQKALNRRPDLALVREAHGGMPVNLVLGDRSLADGVTVGHALLEDGERIQGIFRDAAALFAGSGKPVAALAKLGGSANMAIHDLPFNGTARIEGLSYDFSRVADPFRVRLVVQDEASDHKMITVEPRAQFFRVLKQMMAE